MRGRIINHRGRRHEQGRQIDEMAYKLYNLTPEVIAVVEEKK